MALTALVTTTDLANRNITWDAGEAGAVSTFLDVAAGAIREAAGTPITLETSTVRLVGYRDRQRIRLPGPPIITIATVSLDGTTIDDYRLEHTSLWRRVGWSDDDGPADIDVTYTHGHATVPAYIVDLACSMVAAALVALRSASDGEGLAARDIAVQSVRIDDFSETYATSPAMAEAITRMMLPAATRRWLAAQFGNTAAVMASR